MGHPTKLWGYVDPCACPREARPMPYFNRTYRTVDGERIDGSWRHVFIKNGNTNYLTDLKVYADGMIDCWGLVDLATFRQKVAAGWVATSYAQGAPARLAGRSI